MKSIRASSLTVLVLFVLGLCSLNVDSVSAKTIVRGDHRPKTLKHFSMQSRQLMTDKDKDKEDPAPEDDKEADPEDDDQEEEEETPAPEDDKEDDKNNDKNKDDTEEEDPQEAEEEVTLSPEVESAMEPDVTNVTGTEEIPVVEEILPETQFSVPLEPFSLTVDGDVVEEDLNLDAYLLTYMKGFMNNLIAIDLQASVFTEEDEDDMDTTATAAAENATRTRSLRAYHVTARVLTVQSFYYEGTATFEGPPMRTSEEVDAALTYALQDTAALQAHLQSSDSPEAAGATVTAAKPNDPAPTTTTDAAIGVEEETTEDDGLSTTGLSIVIVASCVGGISLLIIIMVGLSGPSGSTSGKGGLPEQALH
jgi:hypothetical protein